jgi:Protein of unknown function (DUF1822)
MKNVKLSPIIVPLDDKARNLATRFASTATTPEKKRRVYLNTLAVLAMNNFLVWMEIDTDLRQGDSWNSVIRSFHDVADLVLRNIGTLECRPILPEETSIDLPLEVREERIGCIVVKICEKFNQAQLLGCYIAYDENELPEQLKIENLSSLDSLLDHLEWLEKLKARKELANLRNFLAGTIQVAWEKDTTTKIGSKNSSIATFRGNSELKLGNVNNQAVIKSLIAQLHSNDDQCRQDSAQELGEIGIGNPDAIAALTKQLEIESHEETVWQIALSLGKIVPNHPKAAVRVRKHIDLGVANLALIISCTLDSKKSIRVRVQVEPGDSQMYLPTGCKLSILDESGKVFKSVQEQGKDDYIQRSFHADLGDCFGIKLELGNASYTECCTV